MKGAGFPAPFFVDKKRAERYTIENGIIFNIFLSFFPAYAGVSQI